VIDGLFAYAFTTGMLATVNPCGFAMLPAYLSYFLGVESADGSPGATVTTTSRVTRAVAVSIAVSLGFLLVFVVIGAVVRAGGDFLIDWAKYVTIPIGLALAGLGVAMVLGYHLPFTTPRLDKGGRDRTVVSMFVFGISYAIASIGCTLPLFIGAALTSFTTRGTVSGMLLVLTYGAGMALVLTALTVTLALARGGLLAGLRHVLPYVERVAGVFLVLAGLYLVYYWIYNLRFDATGSTTGNGLATTVEGWSFDTQTWLQDRGGWILGTLLVAALAVTAAVSLARRRHTVSSR
jgi:cytochrome c biogenesis protein CcdA